MVASVNGDPYTPFPQGIVIEEGPQSSEEGSGLHSPIFGAPFLPPHGDSSRELQSSRNLLPYRAFTPISSIKSGTIKINSTFKVPRASSPHNLTIILSQL